MKSREQEREEAVAWAQEHAEDLADSITEELDAPRLDTGESAGPQPQRPEEYGGNHGTPVLSIQGVGLPEVSTDLDGVTVSGAGLGAAYDQDNYAPKLAGRLVQRSINKLWAHVEDANSEAAQVVRKAVETMTAEQQETFRLIFVERLSERDAAERLGISQPAVHYRVETLKRIVTRALVQAAGGTVEAIA